MGLKYYWVESGEWVRINKRGHRHQCCDCALIHTVNFRNGENGSLEVQWKRNDRATAAARRPFKFTKDAD